MSENKLELFDEENSEDKFHLPFIYFHGELKDIIGNDMVYSNMPLFMENTMIDCKYKDIDCVLFLWVVNMTYGTIENPIIIQTPVCKGLVVKKSDRESYIYAHRCWINRNQFI